MKNTVISFLTLLLLFLGMNGLQAQCHAAFEWEIVPNTLQVHFINHSTSEHDITSNQWTFGDGGTSDGVNPTHTYAAPGTYNVCLIIMDNFGCASDVCHQVTVSQVVPECHAAFVFDQIGTTLEVEFADQSTSNHDIISWHWNFGDGQMSEMHNPHHTYAHTGTYNVCLIITDNAGCSSDICHVVHVESGQGECHADFEWDQVGTSLEVHFFDTSDDDPDIVSWHWNFGDGHTSEEQNPTHTFATYGTHAVCLIVTNEFGCVSDICWEVEIEGTPQGCHAAFEWQQFENTTEIHFINHSTSEHDIISWHWTFGDGTDSNDPSPNHNYAHSGTYVVCLRIEDNTGCV
ncbi:MAG: PKD domain-containing protein, partial [Bacteroidota bacterium]|nr:PKD domain-containing protein [Bacteroidota bacterium]